MAQKRMFTKQIVDSDAFLDMPVSSQLLYFHLNMQADDDGFVGNPKKTMRLIGVSEDDFKILIAKRFILIFKSGVIVIKHWKLHNTIQKDRYHTTQYTEEKAQITTKNNDVYTECIQNVNRMETQSRLDEIRLDKIRLDEEAPATAKNLKQEFFENKLFEVLKQTFPNRNYDLEFDLMIDWWQKNKGKMPKNISAFKNWLAYSKPQGNQKIIREKTNL